MGKKTFKLHWLVKDSEGNPVTEIVKGNTISEAFSLAGYGAGALSALDYFEEIKEGRGRC